MNHSAVKPEPSNFKQGIIVGSAERGFFTPCVTVSKANVVDRAILKEIERAYKKAATSTGICGEYVKHLNPDIWEKAKMFVSGNVTVIKWGDGTITKVRKQETDEPDMCAAFEAALVRKLFGSRSHYKKHIQKMLKEDNERHRKKIRKENHKKAKELAKNERRTDKN